MTPLGEIVEIVGRSMVLIQSDAVLSPDQIVSVFRETLVEGLKEKYGFERLSIPKGELRILAKQAGNYYLAEAFRGNVERERVVEKRATGTSLLAGLLGQQEIVKENIPGPPSATLGAPTMQIHFTNRVEVGDKIGRP